MIGFKTMNTTYTVSERTRMICGGRYIPTPRRYLSLRCIEGLPAEIVLAGEWDEKAEVITTSNVEKILTAMNC